MSNNTYTGGAYTLKGTVDPINDIWLVQNGSVYYEMNRNVLLGVTGTPLDTTTTQTITGAKTFSTATLTAPTINGTITGTYTLSGTPTFPSSVATLTAVQTLTNKTLTSPSLTSPNITNASITADALSGYTTSNSGTIYGIAVTTGKITGANTINGAALVNTTITPNALNLQPQTSSTTSSGATTSTTYSSLNDSVITAVTLTIGVNGIAVVSQTAQMYNTTNAAENYASFAVSGASTIASSDLNAVVFGLPTVGSGMTLQASHCSVLTGLTPGSTTFTMTYRVSAGTGTFTNRTISVIPL